MTTRYILARSGSGMLPVTLEKMGTSPMGSTMMNSATVARTRSIVGSGLIYSHLFCGGPGGICTHDLRRVRATSVPCSTRIPGWTTGPKNEPVRKTISSFKRRLTSPVKRYCERESSSGLRIHLSGSRPRTEILVLSATDALVNSVIEDAVIGLSALFTSHPPRLVSRLERRLFHRSITHR